MRADIRCLLAATFAIGLASASPSAAAVTGACHVSPVVADLDRSVRFYRDLLGLESESPATANGDVHGLPKARVRSVILHVPGARCGVEPVEFDNVDRAPVQRRIQDPGAVTLILLVRDLDGLFAKLQAARVEVVSTGGAPVSPSPTSKTRAVIVKDPDGNFVELAQLVPQPATTVAATSNVFDLRFRVTVSSQDEALQYYRDGLGIAGKLDAFAAIPGVMAMMGLPPTVEYRANMTTIPGSTLILEFLELKGIERATRPARIQDPGSYRLQLTVDNIDRALDGLRKVGARAIGRDGTRLVAQDLNNVFLVLQVR